MLTATRGDRGVSLEVHPSPNRYTSCTTLQLQVELKRCSRPSRWLCPGNGSSAISTASLLVTHRPTCGPMPMVYDVQAFREGWGGLDHPCRPLPGLTAPPLPLVPLTGIFFLSLY